MLPSGQAGAKCWQVYFSEELPKPGSVCSAPLCQLQFKFQWGRWQFETSNVLKALCCTLPIWKADALECACHLRPLRTGPQAGQSPRGEGVACSCVPFLLGFFLSPILVLSSLNPCSLIQWQHLDCCWVSYWITATKSFNWRAASQWHSPDNVRSICKALTAHSPFLFGVLLSSGVIGKLRWIGRA